MKVLTDVMLKKEMHTTGALIIIFPMIVLIFLLIILLRIYYAKTKERRKAGVMYHGYGYLLSITITLILMAVLIFSIDDISMARAASAWYVTSEEVISKRMKINTGESGQDSYYIVLRDGEVHVSQQRYDSLLEKEMVYVLRDAYTGSRLKE